VTIFALKMTITFSLPREFITYVNRRAKELSSNRSHALRQIIKDHIEQQKKRKP